jgi:general secretion pathway protein M
MKDWYDNLEAREQIFVLIGAVFVILALIYYLLWTPLDTRQRQAATRVDNWERSLAELRPLQAMVRAGGVDAATTAISSQQAPIIIVSQTLQSRGLEQYRRRSQPTTNNGIRVEFEEVAFDDLVLWLGDLSDNYAMHVQSGSLSEGNAVGDGRINASLTLERSL